MPPASSQIHQQSPAAGEHRCDILLTGAIVLTIDDHRTVHSPGAIAITGNRIAAVGPEIELAGWEATTRIDCAGKALIPGFVDGHNHLYQSLAKGLGEGMSIVPWLCEFMWPYSIAMQPSDAIAGVRLGAIEAARAGITTVIDNHYAPADPETTLAVAETIEQVGLRGAVARGIVGEPSRIAKRRGQPAELFRYSAIDELAITRECIEARPSGEKVAIWPAPLNLTYVEPSLVRGAIELAAELGTRWHTHCCEGSGDPGSYVEEYGQRPVQWLADEGLLDERATLAHAVWLDDSEIDSIAAAGAGVAHNPASNAYLASGTMRLRDLLDRGVPVSLGTDGPSCGHREDMFEAMKLTIFAQRLGTEDPTVVRAEEALELATREGARYAGVDAGILEAGRLADIVAVDLSAPHLNPMHRAVSALVYSAQPSDISWTMVGGEFIYRDGRCLLVDEEAALDDARRHADDVVARAGMTGLLQAWDHGSAS
ncbi:amidohydrolase [Saxibacter everestensis]|uniref:Amidohydrolase n=1 Tax=Saxibacter everestensis TaxID=2909229 RepID=A0ABY8QR19_9MICO|nr:amidohydrolase [Brevibacteriaceae bacterium ZFBP1038]